MDLTRNDRVVAQGALTWRPTERTDITAIGIYQQDHNPPNYNVIPLVGSLFALPGQRIPNSRFFGEPGINRGDKEYTALSLLATHEFNDWLSLRSNSRSEEHTSELQSLMRISYAVFCLKKKNTATKQQQVHKLDYHHISTNEKLL